ncbi:ABC transporter permease [Bordetella genomosp. 7]|uniref:ABC transporter permease n=1 Tax=Bordetella genomosp. 7 TaxID=1416805 RepID=UPI000B9E9DBF|nr:ABC transporter permease [Bordetella genomosp. 7]
MKIKTGITLPGLRKSLFAWVVIIPTLLATIYFAIFAHDRYASTALVVVRQAQESPAAAVPGLSLLTGVLNPTSREETLFLSEYVRSNDMMNYLDQQMQWPTLYAGRIRDPLYWLPEGADSEDRLEFFQRIVQVHFDDLTGLLRVEVQAFDAATAEQMLSLILRQSEHFINEISHRIARDHVAFAAEELVRARRTYEEKSDQLVQFQNEHGMLDSEAVATSRAGIIANIESQLATERATLTALLSKLEPASPQAQQQRNRIRALEKQLVEEKEKLASSSGTERLNTIAAQFRNLSIDAQVAEEAYKLALSAQENARIEANKKIRSLVTVVSPNRPDTAEYPRSLYNIITLFVLLCLLYGILRFVLVTIADHRD